MLLYEDKIKTNREAFVAKVISISQALGIEPEWLMQVFMNESGMNHQAVNKQAGDSDDAYTRTATRATGLIQFMPATARALGTSTQALYNMSNIQQLDYVFKYLKPYANKMLSYIDVYFTVFFPMAVGKPDNWVFQSDTLSAGKIALQNAGFDLNKDSILTVAEVRTAMLKKVPAAWQAFFLKKKGQ
ncbi:hypothetical protein FACS189464_1810 [Bacteroidia bacterium]|nr:hypothetical protein FACS189464_1810 [Bacteroidia bacterium]